MNEITTAVDTKIAVSEIVIPYDLIYSLRFGGATCFLIQSWKIKVSR
jgi:hypothetical protein